MYEEEASEPCEDDERWSWQELYGAESQLEEKLSRVVLIEAKPVELIDLQVIGDVLYDTCIGADVNEEFDAVESRESERDMATDTRAGVMLDTGDE